MPPTPAPARTHHGDSITRTICILLCAFATFVWSLLTPPHRTFPARLLIFQPLWGVRIYLQDLNWLEDLALFLTVHSVFGYVTGSWRLLSPRDFWWLDTNNNDFMLYLKIFSLLGVCGSMAGGIVHRGQRLKSEPDSPQRVVQESIDESLLPPLLIPSRTSHSRMFPQKHAFSYSYLFVGIPIGIRGRLGKALSVDDQQSSWFNVKSEDYLSRGSTQLGLADKLKRYLHTQGITDRDYSFAYLVTAPKFFGYSFNPVSFWYLYDSDVTLRYMILEVNNTFDERRMYLLKATETERDGDATFANGNDKGYRQAAKVIHFTDIWDKDFHVSPFNSRKGSYSLRAIDPLAAYQETGYVRFDNTVVLRSSKESPKLVARVWSESPPSDATTISNASLARFIASWWWVGLLTFPRIVWEAQKLFFTKKLHVWYRPEVTTTSIGRSYTTDEEELETFFRAFLEHVVEQISTPFRLIYDPAHAAGEEVVMYSPGFTYEEEHQRTMTLQVTSPAFYSRFVHYAHAKEAFDRECLATDSKNRTINIHNPNLLRILLDAMQKTRKRDHANQLTRSALENFRWSILKRLRCPPPSPSYSSTESTSDYEITDIRTFQSSELDLFLREQHYRSGVYRRIVVKLFLAQRFALGIPALIVALDWTLRAVMFVLSMYVSSKTQVGDVLRPGWKFGMEEGLMIVGLIGLANSVHIWSWAKG